MPPEMTMPDSAALTVRHPIRVALMGIGLAALLLLVLFIAFRLRETYSIQTELSSLKTAHKNHVTECEAYRVSVEERLNMTERVLFGDVIPQVDKNSASHKPAARSDTLLFRNDRELRARIEALERWRLRADQ